MTLDINELERLLAVATDTDVHARDLARHRILGHLPAILSRLKAVEEMREAIRAVESGGIPSSHGPNVRLMELPPLARLLSSAGAYDAASRPISATSGVDAKDSAVDGASS